MDRSKSNTYAADGAVLVGNVLAHHGVLGMKWGHRRGSAETSSGKISEDHATAEAHKKQVRENGTKALSNKELQELVTRMNLEQQHRNLSANNTKPSRFEIGQKHVNKILSVGRTLNDINNMVNSPVGKAIRTASKAQKVAKAAKKVAEVVED